MKKDVYISIKGSQQLDGDSDSLEMTTQGSFYNKNGKFYLSYNEGELAGLEKCRTTLKISPDGTVTMMRRGQTKRVSAISVITKRRTAILQLP